MVLWHPNKKSSRKEEQRKERRESFQRGSSREIFRTERHDFPDRKGCKYPAELTITVQKKHPANFQREKARKLQRKADPSSIGLLTALLEARRHQTNILKIPRENDFQDRILHLALIESKQSKDVCRQATSQRRSFLALILQILERVLHQNEEINKKWGNARSQKQPIQCRRGVEGIYERIKGKCQRDTGQQDLGSIRSRLEQRPRGLQKFVSRKT